MPFPALYASVQLNHLNKGFYQFEIIKKWKEATLLLIVLIPTWLTTLPDKDEDFWQSSFLLMWPVQEPKISYGLCFFFLFLLTKKTIGEYTYYRYLWKSFEIFEDFVQIALLTSFENSNSAWFPDYNVNSFATERVYSLTEKTFKKCKTQCYRYFDPKTIK